MDSRNYFINKVALLLSEKSPLYKKVLELNHELSKSRKTLGTKIYGKPFTTFPTWMNGKGDSHDPETIQRLCEHFNKFLENHPEIKEICQPLHLKDFSDDISWMQFAEKIGYKLENWMTVFEHIDEVKYKRSEYGHPQSVEKPAIAREIQEVSEGVSFLYLKSNATNNKPVLIRATLHVRHWISAARAREKYIYVPCTLRIRLPDVENKKPKESDYWEYVGSVSKSKNYLYFLFCNPTNNRDLVYIIVENEKMGIREKIFKGLYTSINASGSMYSSAAILERRNDDIEDKTRLEKTRQYLIEKPCCFFDGLEKSAEGEISDALKKRLEMELKDSPFTPFS